MIGRTALILLSLTLMACGEEEAARNETGSIVTEGAMGVFSLKVGDCFNDEQDSPRDTATTLDEVPGVPCDQPHDNEVFASYRVALDKHPGEETLSQIALEGCVDRFESFVGMAYNESVLDTVPLYPTRWSWIQHDDREVLCAIYRSDGQKMTGSMREAEM